MQKRIGLIICVLLLNACKPKQDRINIDFSDPLYPVININTERSNEPGVKSRVHIYLELDSQRSSQPVLLKCVKEGNLIRFVPQFPLQKGNEYRVQVDWFGQEVSQIFSCNPLSAKDTTSIHIRTYPRSGSIPRNILQFHLVFSEPMLRLTDVYKKVEIRDDKGNKLPYMWREKSDWSNDGTHLALMLHPGRVKRGISFEGREGPLFVPGDSYTLVLTAPIIAVSGNEITERVLKTFKIMNNDYVLPKIEAWGFDSTKLLYFIRFNEVMDYGTVVNGLHLKEKGKLTKQIPISKDDQTWTFSKNNSNGFSHIFIEEIVSDLAANRLHRLFEEKELESMKSREGIELELR